MPIDPILYIDPQAANFLPCPVCGGACYPPGYHCLRCERERP